MFLKQKKARDSWSLAHLHFMYETSAKFQNDWGKDVKVNPELRNGMSEI